MTRLLPIAAVLPFFAMLAACSPAAQDGSDSGQQAVASPAPSVAATSAIVSHADWAGKWIGVEGMYLDITLAPDGTYKLEMQSDLDTVRTATGTDVAEGIAFARGGEQLVLKAASGDDTGLKYLAGKSDCLMVAQGEGYCRD